MPTTEAPRQQAPMEAARAESQDTTTQHQVIDQQPKSEPRPQPENEFYLRGGGMNLGCTCCDGSCSFHRHCC